MSIWSELINRFKRLRLARNSERSQEENEQQFSNGSPRDQDSDDSDSDLPDFRPRGRGGFYFDDFARGFHRQSRIVSSSNVHSYSFEPESPASGILYVTFLYWAPGVKQEDRKGPGSTYAYYDFPTRKFNEFERASNESAGRAVWDYCRVRGTVHGHQHRYRLIQTNGDYVPRKATAAGFRRRTISATGVSPNVLRMLRNEGRTSGKAFRESTLPEFFFSRQTFHRGEPNRGEPNRGEPNRG